MYKLSNNRGETLIEVLGAIMIATLSAALLLSFSMASANLGTEAREADERHYTGLTAADAHGTLQSAGTTPSATITLLDASGTPTSVTASVNIEIYGSDDSNLRSYKAE